MVGFYASGPVVRAFADSLGSRHWHRVETFHFDWCLYHRADKAVKTAYAGTHWDDAAFAARLEQAAARVPLLGARHRACSRPAAYRAAFSHGRDGRAARHAGLERLLADANAAPGSARSTRLADGRRRMAASVQLDEDVAAATRPAFTAEGFMPARRAWRWSRTGACRPTAAR